MKQHTQNRLEPAFLAWNTRIQQYGLVITQEKYLIKYIYRSNCYLSNQETGLPPSRDEVYFLPFLAGLNRRISEIPKEKLENLQRLISIESDDVANHAGYCAGIIEIQLEAGGTDQVFGIAFSKPAQVGDLLAHTTYFDLLPDDLLLPKPSIATNQILFLPLGAILSTEIPRNPFIILESQNIKLYSRLGQSGSSHVSLLPTTPSVTTTSPSSSSGSDTFVLHNPTALLESNNCIPVDTPAKFEPPCSKVLRMEKQDLIQNIFQNSRIIKSSPPAVSPSPPSSSNLIQAEATSSLRISGKSSGGESLIAQRKRNREIDTVQLTLANEVEEFPSILPKTAKKTRSTLNDVVPLDAIRNTTYVMTQNVQSVHRADPTMQQLESLKSVVRRNTGLDITTIEQILAKYNITSSNISETNATQFPQFTAPIPSNVADTMLNLQEYSLKDRTQFNQRWLEAQPYWSVHWQRKDSLYESFVVPKCLKFRYSRLCSQIQNLDFFYFKDMMHHLVRYNCISVGPEGILPLLQAHGWMAKRGSHTGRISICYPAALEYIPQLIYGFHLFNSVLAVFEYVSRFPYLMEENERLIATLRRYGWLVDVAASRVFYGEGWHSLEEMRVLFWTFPYLFFEHFIRTDEQRDRVLLSIGLPAEYAELNDEDSETFPRNRSYSALLTAAKHKIEPSR